MTTNDKVIDIFDFIYTDEEETEPQKQAVTVDKALFDCLNSKSDVDISYIAKKAGVSVSEAVSKLKGAIFQDPAFFENAASYSKTEGWVVSQRYLSGNAREKLKIAESMNKRFRGKFLSNIDALKKILPPRVEIDDIHLNLGASWISTDEITSFICYFLNLKYAPEVYYYEDLKRYKIQQTAESKTSVLNTITYGVSEERGTEVNRYRHQYLTALDIIEDTLNAKSVKVCDNIPTKKGSAIVYEPVINQNKTVEAIEKQKAILEAFKDYVYSTPQRVARFEGYYNDKMVGYTYSAYNGDFLSLKELNPDVVLYKHQRDAVARVLLSGGNVLFCHDVGTGKTYEMIISVHELYRMDISRKNMIVVPNNVLKATVNSHRYLYKDDKILAVYPKDFTPENRNKVLEEIKNGDYVAVYMAYSSFDMIVMSKQYYVDKLSGEIRTTRAAAYNTNNKHEKAALEAKERRLSKQLLKYIEEEKDCPWLSFEKLGINTLVVDEAHNYKNIPIRTSATGVVGLGGGSSKKCREMLEKVHNVDRVIFATGTPLTNSLADLFAFQSYLQPNVLKYHNIDTFDAWINTFGKRETSVECDVDANSSSLRTTTRFSSFHNLDELMSLFTQVCDYHHMPKDEEGLPKFEGYIDITLLKTKAQTRYINELSKRTERVRSKKVSRTEDNLLKITVDGRMCALDERMVDEYAQRDYTEDCKIDACARNVYKMHLKHPQSVQIVFSDIGTPKSAFNVYDELAYSLTELGMARSQIAFIHDATSEKARSELFSAMNKGKIKVVIGSTPKLGVGVNVQERLVAIHHLSVPWKPSDMVQREGRILRKGNTSEQIYIFRYITKGSFDSYLWQILKNKQQFISSFLSGTSAGRDMDDIDGAVLNYAEIVALAVGNPLIKKRFEIANKLDRTKISCRSRQREMQQLRAVIDATPKKISKLDKLANLAAWDYELYTKMKESVPNEERISFGDELLASLTEHVGKETERIFTTYQGFGVYLPEKMHAEDKYILIKSANGGVYRCDMGEDKTPMGCSKTIDYLLDHLGERADNLRSQAKHARKQLREAKEDLGKDNPYLAEIERLSNELAEVDKELESALAEVA